MWLPVSARRSGSSQGVSVSQNVANVPSSPVPGGTGLSTGFTSGSTMSPWSSWYGRSPPDAVSLMVAATITRFRS